MHRIVNLILFALICIILVGGIVYKDEINYFFYKGDYEELVIDNKPTIITFINSEKKDSRSHKKVGELLASLSNKYEDELSTTLITIQGDYGKELMKELNIIDDKIPAVIVLDSKGSVISVYERDIPVESIVIDINNLIK